MPRSAWQPECRQQRGDAASTQTPVPARLLPPTVAARRPLPHFLFRANYLPSTCYEKHQMSCVLRLVYSMHSHLFKPCTGDPR